MNTRAVSKLLGVSASTVQRWVKQLELEMDRNEFGHYIYKEEDVQLLKEFKQQIQNGTPMNEIKIAKKRVGTVKVQQRTVDDEKLSEKIKELERKLDNKADTVVSYQLLKHREEIEDMQKQIKQLQEKIEHLTELVEQKDEETKGEDIPMKKRRTLHSLFGIKF